MAETPSRVANDSPSNEYGNVAGARSAGAIPAGSFRTLTDTPTLGVVVPSSATTHIALDAEVAQTGTAPTVGVQTVVLAAISIQQDGVYKYTMKCTAVLADNSAAAWYEERGAIRVQGGAVNVMANAIDERSIDAGTGLANNSAQVLANGAQVTLQATGAANKDLSWTGRIYLM